MSTHINKGKGVGALEKELRECGVTGEGTKNKLHDLLCVFLRQEHNKKKIFILIFHQRRQFCQVHVEAVRYILNFWIFS